MSLMLNSSLGDSTDNFTVLFDDLSHDAQDKLSTLHNDDGLWQMLPIAYLHESKQSLSQDEIDYAALLTHGYYC